MFKNFAAAESIADTPYIRFNNAELFDVTDEDIRSIKTMYLPCWGVFDTVTGETSGAVMIWGITKYDLPEGARIELDCMSMSADGVIGFRNTRHASLMRSIDLAKDGYLVLIQDSAYFQKKADDLRRWLDKRSSAT